MPDRDRRMVLKSPPHTARIPTLREMFPQAQFIHTVRHPYEVFASTMRLMRVMYGFIGVQEPVLGPLPGGGPSLEEYVIDTMDLLYRDFFAEQAMLPPGRLSQVRYEDLALRPIDEVGRVYRELGLGSIESIRPISRSPGVINDLEIFRISLMALLTSAVLRSSSSCRKSSSVIAVLI